MRGRWVVAVARGLALVWVVGCGGGDDVESATTTMSADASTTTTVTRPSPTTTAAAPAATPTTAVSVATTVAPPAPPAPPPVSTTRPPPAAPAAPPPPAPAAPPAAGPRSVVIADYVYAPDPIEVRAGSSVTWTNRDTAPHTATDVAGRWDTGSLADGQSATVRFDAPGTYDYLCSLHPTMKGRVVVIA